MLQTWNCFEHFQPSAHNLGHVGTSWYAGDLSSQSRTTLKLPKIPWEARFSCREVVFLVIVWTEHIHLMERGAMLNGRDIRWYQVYRLLDRYSCTYQPCDQVFVLFKSRICSAKIPKSINRSNLGWFMLIVYDHWMIFKLGVVSGTLNRCSLDRDVIHALVCLFGCFLEVRTAYMYFAHTHTDYIFIFAIYTLQ